MKPSRNVGLLSALQLPSIADALKETTASCKLGVPEERRLKTFYQLCKPLVAETQQTVGVEVAAKTLGAIDARVDRGWYVVRDLFASYARFADVSEIGEEAARLTRQFFPDVEFTRLETSAQLNHGLALLESIDNAEISKELFAVVRPALQILKADHVEYKAAIQAHLVRVERASALVPARKAALDALQSFVTLVEALAETDEEIAQVGAMLAPIDTLLEKVRREKPKPAATEPVNPSPDPVKPTDDDTRPSPVA